MAKKPKKKPSRTGGGGRPAHNAAVPLNVFRARRAMGPMGAAFAQWYSEGNAPAEEAALYLDVATDVAASYLEVAGGGEVTAFDPEPLVELMDTLEAANPVAMRQAMSAFHVYLDFLMETGRWTGTAEDLNACHELLIDEEVDEDDDEPAIVVPGIPEEEEAAYLATVPLLRQACALLDWVGAGRPVTAAGALRLKDIEAAAACIDVVARGRGATPTGEADALARTGTGETEVVLEYASMYDLPPLASLWRTLVEAGTIRLTSSRAVPTGDVDPRADGASGLEACRHIVGEYLWETVFDADAARMIEDLNVVQATILALACLPSPPAAADVLPLLEEFIEISAHNTSHPLAPDQELDQRLVSAYSRMAYRDLERLGAVGLLDMEPLLRVPPALVRSIAQTVGQGFDFEITYPPGMGPARRVPSGRTADLGLPAAGSTASVYQLKIQLKGSKPPIWRRVEVASDLRLDQLHEVVQGTFAWAGGHLHEFRTGGFPGQAYAPADEEQTLEGTADESLVTLSDLLTAEGQKLDYMYDFGDGWDHSITLEKILPADPQGSGRLPRCTGGRRAAPMEDSGGLDGWVRKVEAANDPSHPEHAEVLEWLGQFGLEGDVHLDPAAFDVEQANETLQDLLADW